jgi:hypothetical protein
MNSKNTNNFHWDLFSILNADFMEYRYDFPANNNMWEYIREDLYKEGILIEDQRLQDLLVEADKELAMIGISKTRWLKNQA